MKLRSQIALLLGIVLLFGCFNAAMYCLLSRRLGNNFSGVAQTQMVEVARYLPHTPTTTLPTLPATLHLQGDLPVLDGAAALLGVYGAIVHNVYPAGCVTFEGGAFSDDNTYGENFAPDSAMQFRNTVRGYRAVVDGSADILFCAAPSDAQRQYAREQGVTLEYVPIGLEGFVFFVNAQNPVDNLTCAQVRDVYAGVYTNWAELGGARRIINPITRMQGSGSQTAFETFMGDSAVARKSPLAITGGSIGFSFRYYVEDMVGNSQIKMLSLDGVAPTVENIRSREYPLVSEFYAVYRQDNSNENIPLLLEWLLGPQGQALIAACGYVPLS